MVFLYFCVCVSVCVSLTVCVSLKNLTVCVCVYVGESESYRWKKDNQLLIVIFSLFYNCIFLSLFYGLRFILSFSISRRMFQIISMQTIFGRGMRVPELNSWNSCNSCNFFIVLEKRGNSWILNLSLILWCVFGLVDYFFVQNVQIPSLSSNKFCHVIIFKGMYENLNILVCFCSIDVFLNFAYKTVDASLIYTILGYIYHQNYLTTKKYYNFPKK